MSLYESFYNLLSKINEADLNNRKNSKVSDEFFSRKKLDQYIDGLMDKYGYDFSKILDELNSKLSDEIVKDGCTIKEDSEVPIDDYKFGGMEKLGIRTKDIKAWEALAAAGIEPAIVTKELRLLDPNKKRGFKVLNSIKFDKNGLNIPVKYFITVKDPETGKIHNVYEKTELMSAAMLKTIIDNPINAPIINKHIDYSMDLGDIKQKIQARKLNQQKWREDNSYLIGDLTSDLQYVAYILSEMEGYPIKIIANFLNSDRATPENIKFLTEYYRINQENNPFKESYTLHENKYSEPVFAIAGKGEEGVIAANALKELGLPFLTATTLSIPYTETPKQTVRPLSPFQKPKEPTYKKVRITAIPKTVAEQLLDIKYDENGITAQIPEEKPEIDEKNNVLYVQGENDLKPFALPIAEIRSLLDQDPKRFGAGTLTADEQDEVLNTRNFTQRGIGGKQITLNDEQIKYILEKIYALKPFNFIFNSPEEIIDIYQSTKGSLTKEANLIKRMLSLYIHQKLAQEYPGLYDEYPTNTVRLFQGKNGIKYNAIVPLNPDKVFSFKGDKAKTVADELNMFRS